MDMTITAKFPGKCSVCGGAIRVGAEIEWAKDSGAKHTACAAGKPAPAAPATPRAPRTRREPPPTGPEIRNDRDSYSVGDVRVVQLTAREIAECETRQSISATDIPGEPCKGDRRRVAVVVIHASRISQEWADDNGYMGRYGAIVRLATPEEAAPVLADRAVKAQAKANAEAKAKAWTAKRDALIAGRIYVEPVDLADRQGAVVIHEERRGLHGTISERWAQLPDGSILSESHAYDDHRCGRWVTTDQLLDLARASTRTLEDAIRGQHYSAIDRAIVWLAAQAGKTPRSPVTVTLHGLEHPIMLTVRLSRASGMVIAEPVGGGSVRVPEGESTRLAYEWAWQIDHLRAQLDAPKIESFSDIEFAPGAEVDSDCLPLPGGLWIDGMRAALTELETR